MKPHPWVESWEDPTHWVVAFWENSVLRNGALAIPRPEVGGSIHQAPPMGGAIRKPHPPGVRSWENSVPRGGAIRTPHPVGGGVS